MTDVNNNPMPANTAITVGSNYVYYTPAGQVSTKPQITIDAGFPVLNTNQLGGTPFTLTVELDCSLGTPVAYPAGTVNIVVTTPQGNKTTIPITVN